MRFLFSLMVCATFGGLLLSGDARSEPVNEVHFSFEQLPISWDPGTNLSRIGQDMVRVDDHLILASATAQVLVFDVSSSPAELVQVVDLAESSGLIQEADVSLSFDDNRLLVGAAGGYATIAQFGPLQRVGLYAWSEQRLHLLALDSREDTPFTAFGRSVALSNGYAFVGAPEQAGGQVHVLGAGNELHPLSVLSAPDLGSASFFGRHLSAGAGQLAVAAPGEGLFPGSGTVRLYDLSDPDLPQLASLTLPLYDTGAQMSWLDGHLFVHGKAGNDLGIRRGQIVQINNADGSGWAVERIIEIPEEAFFEPSIDPAFFVSEDELLAVARELPGLFSGEFGLVRWANPLADPLSEPQVLVTSPQLGLTDLDEACCIAGLGANGDTLFLADLTRSVRGLATGGVIRLNRGGPAIIREADIVPTYPGDLRELGSGFSASPDGQTLLIGAPGWCEVLETDLDGVILRRFATPDGDDDCGRFGTRIAMVNSTMFVAAPFLDAAGPGGTVLFNRGIVHGFDLDSGALVETLLPAQTQASRYGLGMARHEDRLLVVGPEGVEVWTFASGSAERIQIVEAEFFGNVQPRFAVSGSRVALGNVDFLSGEVIVLDWNGSEYQRLPPVLQEPGNWGQSLLWGGNDTLLLGGANGTVRILDLTGAGWSERDPVSTPWSDFGHSLGHNGCGLLIADRDGISRFARLADLPADGQRLVFSDFADGAFGQNPASEYSFINAGGQDFVSIPYLVDSANRRGGVFRISRQTGLFRDRFEQQGCSF